MDELAQIDFGRVRPLLEGGHLHPEIISIVENNNPGRIFVDQANKPKSALVWSRGMQGFYLIGDHTNKEFVRHLDSYIKRNIEPRLREASIHHFEFSGHHDEWNMELLFPTRALYQFEQIVFSGVNHTLAQGNIELLTINLKTDEWENRGLQNAEMIYRHLNLFWSSQGDFKEKGFGYAVVERDEVIGVCYSSFVTKDTHAIGIETIPQFQNKGIGSHLANLIVEDIVHSGFIPYWDCSLDNRPSQKLAERLGFSQIHRYTCYGFEL